ncbi:MAG TPA: VOC family protein [Nevskiaceae bacterium]|nr:VOC family protein [Nevskiaceae bacterium]
MIHHLSVGTNDPVRARRFYDAVLGALGLRLMKQTERELIYGATTYLLSVIQPVDGGPATVGNGSHIAFAAESRWMVDCFYAAALAHGGSGCAEPGLCPQYDLHYYAAFVRDPDGNKLEAVTMSSR